MKEVHLSLWILFPAGLAALIFGLIYSFEIEPNWLKVEKPVITLTELPSDFDGYTIVQLSDIHLLTAESVQRLHHAVDLANQLQPDMVVLTGDYFTRGHPGDPKILYEELSRLKTRDGVYAILGNNDWRGGLITLSLQSLQRVNITLLRNQTLILQRGGSLLYLVGVDDILEHHDDLPKAMQAVPPDGVVILLTHEPDFADQAALDSRIALQISAHSHGGQVRLPGLPPFITPALGVKYTDGLYRVGEMQLYVNRGIGMVPPLMRLFCRPEVTLITLVGK
jgi:predicted MPP superfamily phosphohydrolase